MPQPQSPTGHGRVTFTIFTRYVLNTGFRFDSAEARALLPHVFAAKQVPLALIGKISETRAFHANDWASVRVAQGAEMESFDFYFDFVLDAVAGLADLWVEQP